MTRDRLHGLRVGVYVFTRNRIGSKRPASKVPIDRLAEIASRISHARVVDAGRIITAGGIASGMELGFHLLRRAGYDQTVLGDRAGHGISARLRALSGRR